MSVRLYMDVHVPRAITDALVLEGVDVITAQQDDARQLGDSELVDRATSQGRVLFTRDTDLLAEAVRRQRAGRPFTGVIYAHQLQVTLGQCVRDLLLVGIVGELEDFADRVCFLPLR